MRENEQFVLTVEAEPKLRAGERDTHTHTRTHAEKPNRNVRVCKLKGYSEREKERCVEMGLYELCRIL